MVVASTEWGRSGVFGKVWTGASGRVQDPLSGYKPHPNICQPDEDPTFL